MNLAMDFRRQFKRDVFIDMYCYRRRGHNESDEPAFTQPVMYKAIGEKPSVRESYLDKLLSLEGLTQEEADEIEQQGYQKLEDELERARSESYEVEKPKVGGVWEGFIGGREHQTPDVDTSVDEQRLRRLLRGLARLPEAFTPDDKIRRGLDQRLEMADGERPIDWSAAEALAFGSLAVEGYPVRLTGQDSERGTFSQRHAVLHDAETGMTHTPLQHLSDDQAPVHIYNSPLSEAGVLGFEYGYSIGSPGSLVCWEAQFGDFVNGAQVIIDQFISSAEAKWLRMSGLVLLLPHGYEGQGPEHSSARPERFLTMSGEDNWQVVNCTTPANYFHVLRRQIHREFRKPLIIFTPKSLLRHKDCVSRKEQFVDGATFHRVLPEVAEIAPPDRVRRVVLSTGKVYYDLRKERDERGLRDVALVRLEQMYPFPEDSLAAELTRYPNADVVWCQEEPANMGAWFFVDRRIEALLERIGHGARRPKYAGRDEAASPATGLLRRHNQEQAKLVDVALTI